MINLLQILKDAEKPLSIQQIREKGINTSRKELRELERKGTIVKVENFANNCNKTLKDEDGKKYPIGHKGTMYYTYKLA